jgi:uncharacterized protein YwqG
MFSDVPRLKLIRASQPKWLTVESLSPVCSLEFRKTNSIPALTSHEVAAIKLSKQDQVCYTNLLEGLRAPQQRELPVNKLLGHPDAIQEDMANDCVMASERLDETPAAARRNLRQTKSVQAADLCQLLLQLDSDARLGLEWMDSGRLYFWIRRQDLTAKRFHKCWVILQSY